MIHSQPDIRGIDYRAILYCCVPHSGQNLDLRGMLLPHSTQNLVSAPVAGVAVPSPAAPPPAGGAGFSGGAPPTPAGPAPPGPCGRRTLANCCPMASPAPKPTPTPATPPPPSFAAAIGIEFAT